MSRNKQVEKNLAKTIHDKTGVGVCNGRAIRIKNGRDICVFDVIVDNEGTFLTFYVAKGKGQDVNARKKYEDFLSQNRFGPVNKGGARLGKKIELDKDIDEAAKMIGNFSVGNFDSIECCRPFEMNCCRKNECAERTVEKDGYTFEPYVGTDYKKGRGLLIVGASHYCDGTGDKSKLCIYPNCESCRYQKNLTRIVIHDYCQIKKIAYRATHSKFYNALLGTDSHECRLKFIRKIIFYNYLQVAEGKSAGDKHPCKFSSKTQRQRNENLFRKLLQEYNPSGIIFWGANIRNNPPEFLVQKNSEWGECSNVKLNGRQVAVFFSRHPSSRQFCYSCEALKDFYVKIKDKIGELDSLEPMI